MSYYLSRAPCKQCNTDHVNIYIDKTEDEVVMSILLKYLQIKDKDIGTVKEWFIHNTNLIKFRSLLRCVVSINGE